MAKRISDEKLMDYNVVKEKKRDVKPLTKSGFLIILISVTAVFLVAAIVVLSLYFTGVFDNTKYIKKKGVTKEEESVEIYEGFVDYTFNINLMPKGKYATITFLCDGTEYIVTAYLFSSYAPNTVNNFVSYAEQGFYNGTVINDVEYNDGETKTAIMTGGGYELNPDGSVTKKIPESGLGGGIKGEFLENGYEDNKLSHTAGVIGMLHSDGNPDDAATDFYILPYDNKKMDGRYAAFAKVTTTTDVQKLQTMARKAYQKGANIKIKKITLTEK